MFHHGKIDDFPMLTIYSTTADNHESTLGTGTNDLENDTWAYTYLCSGKAAHAFELFSSSIDTGNMAANISGSNCGHKFCVKRNYFLIWTLGMAVLIMKLTLNETPVWLRMNPSC